LNGITIDSSDDDENENDSIRVNRELDSNEIDESESQFEKNIQKTEFQHWMELPLIEVMDRKMEMIQFVPIVNLIQMKVMKLNNVKKISNKEFQHWMESQLIKWKNIELQMIQFVSIILLIQMKVTNHEMHLNSTVRLCEPTAASSQDETANHLQAFEWIATKPKQERYPSSSVADVISTSGLICLRSGNRRSYRKLPPGGG
jgi:hypothetical protein